jgi:hypothetical protein
MRFTEPMPTSDLTPTWLVHDPSNAAPEWQAGSLRWRSGELLVACPLEGLVRRPSPIDGLREKLY